MIVTVFVASNQMPPLNHTIWLSLALDLYIPSEYTNSDFILSLDSKMKDR